MIKQITVTFNFDSETDQVSDICTFINGAEVKKKTTRSTKTKEIIMEDEAIIKLEETKLVFNNKAVSDMKIEHENRIVIEYVKTTGKELIPIIGTDLAFEKEGSGNKLTKTNTVAYKGKQNTILAEYGTEFTIEPYKGELWKLVSKNEGVKKAPTSYKDVVKQADEINTDLYTDGDDTTEIGEMTFTL